MKKSLLLTLFLCISFTTQANVNRLNSTQHYPVKSVIKQLNKKGWTKSAIELQNPEEHGMDSYVSIYTLPPISEQPLFTRFNGQKVIVRNALSITKLNGNVIRRSNSKVYSFPNSYDWAGFYNYSKNSQDIVNKKIPIPKTAKVGSSQSMYLGEIIEDGKPSGIFTGSWELNPINSDTAQLCTHHDSIYPDNTTEKQAFCYTIDKQGVILDETIEIISYSENNGEPPMVFKTPTSNP